MKKYFNSINLQLFAEANTQTTALNSTGNDLSPEMKTFYSKDLIEMAKANLVHAQFGERKPLPKNGGKNIEWRKWSSFGKATTPLTEGVTPDGTAVNVGYITGTVSQYGDYTTVSDVLELTAIDNVILEITSKHGDNAGLTLDTIVRNELVKGTNVIYAPIVSGGTETAVSGRYALTANAKLTPDVVAKAVTQLKKMNAPKIDGSYVCVVHPSVAYDLMRHDDWLDAHKYTTSENIFEGELGKLYGVRFVESTEAKIYKGAKLSAAAENLTVASFNTSTKVVGIDETLTGADQTALVGREVIIDGVHYEISAATANGFTVKSAPDSGYPADGDVVYPGEAGAANAAAYACLFMGKGAYGIVDLEGGGMETIVKQKGSAGSADPLNQRSTVGWKISGFCAKILIDEYLVRVECGSSFSGTDTAN